REHRGEVRDAKGQVVAVEAIGVRHVPLPRDPDGHEQSGELREAAERVIPDELAGELGDRECEHEVEEELEPARSPFLLFLGRSSEARRYELRLPSRGSLGDPFDDVDAHVAKGRRASAGHGYAVTASSSCADHSPATASEFIRARCAYADCAVSA